MRFIKEGPEEAAGYIAERIRTLLANGRSVLWLVSGGSNVAIQIAAMQQVPDSLSRNLTIMPVDERFGRYNHRNSNGAQLRKNGFDPKHAEMVDLLGESLGLQDTVKLFNDYFAREVAIGDYIFATLGLGSDGHTAGILPHSPALASTDFAIGYKGRDFERITLCADTLATHCNEVVLCAFGETKVSALHRLAEHEDHRQAVPAMFLREVQNCTVYNDEIEGDVL